MPRASLWGTTPQASIRAECDRRGRAAVVDGCCALLAGGDADEELVRALGGPRAARFLDAADDQRYWLRVWGARGLLWTWEDRAAGVVVAALADEAWRVRELAAKVVARHRVDAALEALGPLVDDPVPRVASAAQRARRLLTEEPDDRRTPPGAG